MCMLPVRRQRTSVVAVPTQPEAPGLNLDASSDIIMIGLLVSEPLNLNF